jgi:hypothetical protein
LVLVDKVVVSLVLALRECEGRLRQRSVSSWCVSEVILLDDALNIAVHCERNRAV